MKKTVYKTSKKSMPVYAGGGKFGDFMQSNAGTIGTVAGAGLGLALAPVTGGLSIPAGIALGSTIGGGVGNVVQGSYEQDQQQETQLAQQQQQQRQMASNSYNNGIQNTPNYGANFAIGGNMHSFGSELSNQDYQTMTEPKFLTSKSTNLTSNIPPQYPIRPFQQPMDYIQSRGINPLPVNAPQLPEADLRQRGLNEMLYKNLTTNQFDGAPRSIPRGQRINPQIVARARAEDARNQAVGQYIGGSQRINLGMSGNIGSLQTLMTDPEMGQIQKLPAKAAGGYMEETRGLDNVTKYGNGGTHQQNKLGGIPIGKKGKVEEGELRWNDFVFTNRY